jgi:hypothetical protein
MRSFETTEYTQQPDVEGQKEIILEIPFGGDYWKKILAATGLKNTFEIRSKLEEMAQAAGYAVIFEDEDGKLEYRARLVPGDSAKSANPEFLAFIGLFNRIP